MRALTAQQAIVTVVFLSLMPSICRAQWWGDPATIDSNAAKLDVSGPPRFEPLLGVEAGWMGLVRSNSDPFPLVFTDGTLGPVQTIADSSIVDSEMINGYRIGVTAFNLTDHLPGLDFEGVFMGADGTSGHAVVSANGVNTANVVPVFFNGFPVAPNASDTFTLVSEMESQELSFSYRPMARAKVLFGIRRFELDERFDIVDTTTVNSPTVNGFFSQTTNEAFGIQFGGEWTLFNNGVFRIFTRGKTGWLENDVAGDAVAANARIEFGETVDSEFSELEIGLSGRIFPWAHLQVAYHGVFLRDFAGVIEQSRDLDILGANGQMPTLGDIDWNGVRFELVVTR